MTNQKVWGKARTKIVDAVSGSNIRDWSEWQDNLVFDSTLTNIATGSQSIGGMFQTCKVGTSSAANEVVGGSTTFTQSGTNITASVSFFTASMVGGIFKYGAVGTSNGLEQYIVSQAGTTAAVSGSGTNVVSPSQGAAWFVQQTQLTSYSIKSQTYVTAPGDCGSTFNGNQVTMLRTFQFGVQGSPYTVSEIGYSGNNNNDGTCQGRIVLSSPDSISTSQFYVVQIVITVAASPASPALVSNVGTGIDTSGTLAWQCWDLHDVSSIGATQSVQGGAGTANMMDGSSYGLELYTSAAPTLNSVPSASSATDYTQPYRNNAGSFASSVVGVATASVTISATTAGETVNSLIFGGTPANGVWGILILNLTNPYTLPNGAFTGTFTLQKSITRSLVN